MIRVTVSRLPGIAVAACRIFSFASDKTDWIISAIAAESRIWPSWKIPSGTSAEARLISWNPWPFFLSRATFTRSGASSIPIPFVFLENRFLRPLATVFAHQIGSKEKRDGEKRNLGATFRGEYAQTPANTIAN